MPIRIVIHCQLEFKTVFTADCKRYFVIWCLQQRVSSLFSYRSMKPKNLFSLAVLDQWAFQAIECWINGSLLYLESLKFGAFTTRPRLSIFWKHISIFLTTYLILTITLTHNLNLIWSIYKFSGWLPAGQSKTRENPNYFQQKKVVSFLYLTLLVRLSPRSVQRINRQNKGTDWYSTRRPVLINS